MTGKARRVRLVGDRALRRGRDAELTAACNALTRAHQGKVPAPDCVYARYRAVARSASGPFGAMPDDAERAFLLDARRAEVYQRSMILGARWCDPAQIEGWADEMPGERELEVYCVYGHEVGRATALRLRAAGLNARFLQGGIDGWQAADQPLADKPAG